MKRQLKIKVNTKKGTITVKRGFFGKPITYDGDCYTRYSINDIVMDFCSREVANFQNELIKIIK